MTCLKSVDLELNLHQLLEDYGPIEASPDVPDRAIGLSGTFMVLFCSFEGLKSYVQLQIQDVQEACMNLVLSIPSHGMGPNLASDTSV